MTAQQISLRTYLPWEEASPDSPPQASRIEFTIGTGGPKMIDRFVRLGERTAIQGNSGPFQSV